MRKKKILPINLTPFDYEDERHNRFMVKLCLIYYSSGDVGDVYEDDPMRHDFSTLFNCSTDDQIGAWLDHYAHIYENPDHFKMVENPTPKPEKSFHLLEENNKFNPLNKDQNRIMAFLNAYTLVTGDLSDLDENGDWENVAKAFNLPQDGPEGLTNEQRLIWDQWMDYHKPHIEDSGYLHWKPQTLMVNEKLVNLDPHLLVIMEEQFMKMRNKNPNMNESHPKEDFVVENFTDRVTSNWDIEPFDFDYDIIATWFNTKRSEHLFNLKNKG